MMNFWVIAHDCDARVVEFGDDDDLCDDVDGCSFVCVIDDDDAAGGLMQIDAAEMIDQGSCACMVEPSIDRLCCFVGWSALWYVW